MKTLNEEGLQKHRVPFVVPLVNPVIKAFLRMGMPMGPMALLTVRGRMSGRERSTPVAVLDHDGNRYVVSVYGLSQWVRNIRAAGEGKLRKGRRTSIVSIVELSPRDAAPILKEGLTQAPGFVKKNFEATKESSMEEIERDAVNHPVFKIERARRPTASQ